MEIGEKIRGIRGLKGLSQENMAGMLGMSLRGYGDIERGTTDLPYSRLKDIAAKLGVSVADIETFGSTVSNFFDQCNSTNVSTGSNTATGTNGANQTNNNYDQRELQHQLEKAQLELKLFQAKKEKAELEARYLREKYEEGVVKEIKNT